LAFVSASEGGQFVNGQVVWNLGTLPAREKRALQVTTRPQRAAARAVTTAVATADPGLQVQKEAALEILGLPAFALDLRKEGDPVAVNGRVTYRVAVTNTGSLEGNQVEILATVPPQLKVVKADGPTQAEIDPQRQTIRFPPVAALAPKQTLNYTVEVQALQAGDVRFRVELRSLMLKEPVSREESTTVYDPAAPPRPAAAPAPAAVPAPAQALPPGLPPAAPPPPLPGAPPPSR
jgi:uncharacterized repeat protein (TIGR01451 family)